MIALIIGGSGSGKSEYAEELACKLEQVKPKTYIATMYPYGEETQHKIIRHQQMRKDKGFDTIECYTSLKDVQGKVHDTVLLECMSNLLANEMYMEEGAKSHSVEEIMSGIRALSSSTKHLLIVSNDVFHDKIETEPELGSYLKNLGKINAEIGKMADVVCEVVYSIPIFHSIKNQVLP